MSFLGVLGSLSADIYGGDATLTARFRSGGNLVDPASVTFSYCGRDRVVHTASPTREVLGVYSVELTDLEVGQYNYRWDGDGSVAEGTFLVEPSVVA